MNKQLPIKPLYIDGRYQQAHSTKHIEVISPLDLSVVGLVPDSSEEDVNDAVQSALDALESWKQTDLSTRIEKSEKFIEYLQDHQDEIAETIHQELGCPIEFARESQIAGYIKELKDLLNRVSGYSFYEEKEGYHLQKDAIGVIACITPWNYPLGQITKKIIPALLMGNTTILKPSSQTPLTAYWVAEAIDHAGFPKGVFNLITGSGSTMGELLSNHSDINMITFTGSTEVGTEVASTALKSMKRIAMELGGKSASILLKGADLDQALTKTCDTVFFNSGQTCSALTRLFVPTSMKKAVENALKEKVKGYKVGENMGPVQSENQFETVKSYVDKGLKEGATLLVGKVPTNRFIEPIIFTDVENSMTIAREEIFGPVLSVITYDKVDEAIEMANDSKYGLSGAVFGPEKEAFEVAKQLRTGNVFVNTKNKSLNVPFGGYKYSGIGRENGLEGLEEFIEIKALIVQE